METGKSRLYLPEDEGGGCPVTASDCQRGSSSTNRRFPSPPTPHTMKIVSGNNVCRDGVGRK